MDLLIPVPAYGIVIYRVYRYAVPPAKLTHHLNTYYRALKGLLPSFSAVREVVAQV
jgi:hypothetical protein